MKQLPTAEEFLKGDKENEPWTGTQEQAMIEFSKLHVQAALESAAENGKIDIIHNAKYGAPNVYIIEKQSILNVYPLHKIK